MTNLQNKIQSIRDSVGGQNIFVRPSIEKLKELNDALWNSPVALDYLKIQRNLNDETIKYFNLGYDETKNAIAIPEYKRNELVNIKYRHIDENAKQRYSQEKGGEVWIFNEKGIDLAKEKGGILITEGQFDAMSAWQAGFKNVISPSSGKESYGMWLELIDNIPKVYIAYDNDKGGKKSAREMSQRIGTDKSYEVLYPEGIKDANEYFKQYDKNGFSDLIRKSLAFYKYEYLGVTDVINSIREKGESRLQLDCMPFVKMDDDWMVMVSGVSGIGKTSYVMNIADELMKKKIPTLVLPFERGIKTVGGRFIQVKYNKTEDELIAMKDSEWEKIIPDVVELPLYFSLPGTNDVKSVVEKAKRFFGVRVVIVDHLDYSLLPSNGNQVDEMKRVLQEWKSICLEQNIIFIVVHHIKKQDGLGTIPKKPRMEDLKGGSASYQVPEAVIMLSSPEKNQIEIDVVKNKGEVNSKIFSVNNATGKIGGSNVTLTEKQVVDLKAIELFDF